MLVLKFFSKKPFSLAKVLTAVALSGAFSASFAQGVFEGSGEEPDNSCVGDACGLVINESQNENADSTEMVEYGVVQNAKQDSAVTIQDSTADSLKYAEFFDDEDSRANYIEENASEYRARKEGFSKSIQFGFRAGAGVNLNLLGKEVDGWNPGFDLEVGAIAKLPLGNDFSAAAGLDFGYRRYSYEADTDYGHNEATASEMLFQIPAFFQYSFDEDGFFIGIGVNVSLKMHGETEFKQTIYSKNKEAKRSNTMPTTGVGFGGLLDLGFSVSKNLTLDLKVVQNLTGLLNRDVIAESWLMNTKLFTSHATLGVTFLL